MYKLIPTSRFERKLSEIAKLSKDETAKIKSILNILVENPFDSRLNTHKLLGKLSEFYACNCGYDCRIVFSVEMINPETKVIYLIDLGSHDDVY